MPARRPPGVRLQATLRRWRAELSRPGPTDGRVHDARVVLKEARAVNRLFRDQLPAFDARGWDRRLRRALKALAPARDEVVMRAVLDRQARRLAEADRDLLDRVLPTPSPPRAAALRRVGPLLDGWGLALQSAGPAGGWATLDPAFARALRRVRRLQKAAGRDNTPALWHRWRRRVKELAYQADWVRPPEVEGWPELRRDAWGLQSRLGDLQDLHITLDHLAGLKLPGRLKKLLRERLRRAAEEAQRRAWRARLRKEALRG